SASMRGVPLDNVKVATKRMIEMLRPDDRAGVVAFTTNAFVVADVLDASVNAKKNIARAIDAMDAISSTNIEEGLRLGHRILPERRANERRAIILLSDGM